MDLGAQVDEKAALAVAQFQGRAGGRLDYSADSLAVVEEMLDEAARYRSQMPMEDIDSLVALLGSYVLAVAQRAHGGVYAWDDRGDQPVLVVGEPVFHVALMAFGKVRGRLGGDKADNIPFFYQGFAERAHAARPGARALYF